MEREWTQTSYMLAHLMQPHSKRRLSPDMFNPLSRRDGFDIARMRKAAARLPAKLSEDEKRRKWAEIMEKLNAG